MRQHYKTVLIILVGMIVGGIAMLFATGVHIHNSLLHSPEVHPHSHQSDDTNKIHVHADWKMVINHEHIRFTNEKYQSIGGSVQHNNIHLHDDEDLVIHRHADDVTFVDFLQSLGYDLTNDCLTTDTNIKFCNENENEVRLIVNGERVMDIKNYLIQEADRILVYYGDVIDPHLRDYVASVTDEACLYSGTCLGRGYKTTSTCGITCEI